MTTWKISNVPEAIGYLIGDRDSSSILGMILSFTLFAGVALIPER
ncbi:hypothetical protein [Leptolyngbya sp. NIES-2104]|nr:hypothetical protein [Leptolyngbya sp. NIES-2104]